MNYLAHAYLSFKNPEILVGNLISDFVKGKKKFDFSPAIQEGIALHRLIDAFTDEHAITKEAKEVFYSTYRLYSGAFVDVTYDHFLANDRDIFADAASLMEFSLYTYTTISSFEQELPDRFRRVFPYMRADNWLYNYQFTNGIKNSYQGLVYRAAYLTESEPALNIFKDHYYFLQNCYHRFFPQLQEFTLDNFPSASLEG
ncbi:MAG: DUF479 domain-containing protein [Chitinophagaceae bacterium]|nr:DUF479 domain-containing protein [Chitinophagaceae bacterium]